MTDLRILALVLGLTAAAAPAQGRSAASVPPLSLRDAANGSLQRLFPAPRGEPTVVIFTATGCPISNSYAPVYRSLFEEHGERVRFFAVNAGDDDAAAIAAHAAEYGFRFPVLLDREHRAVRALGARVTPEAFVVDGGGGVRYGGRIDDRWASRTAKREAPQSHELADAIRAVLAHKVVPTRRTVAYGCAIASRDAEPAAQTSLTYHRDIAPILAKRCRECHREGQVAPFALETYDDAASWGEEIVEFTAAGLMPPWRDCGPRGRFVGDPRLTDAEKDRLAEWVAGGMPAGDPKDEPAAPEYPDGWRLGEPDLVLEMPVTYEVAAGGRDEYVCFPLPTGLDDDVYVAAIELQPGNRRVVHHMVGFLDPGQRGRQLDERDPRPGYRRFGGPGFASEGIFGVWAPGNQPTRLPEGRAFHLRAGSDIVLQMHYYKTGKVERDRSRVGLWFAREPVTHHVNPYWVANFRLAIPAGAAAHTVRWSQPVGIDLEIVDLFPHMHLLGRKMRLSAELPGGDTVELVRVEDWDFNWQLTYAFPEPLKVPKGSTLHLEAVYDNSSGNPRNPHDPPRRVRWGEKTSDEMCIVLMNVVTPTRPKMTWRQLRYELIRAAMGQRRGRRR